MRQFMYFMRNEKIGSDVKIKRDSVPTYLTIS